jgi:pheromone a factor receptor
MALIFPFVTSVHILFGFLTLLYLPCQIHARNVGLSLFLVWTTLACFAYAANTIVWRDNVLNSAPVWCDICANFSIAVLCCVKSPC